MARTDPQVNFRMPAKLKDQLEKVANENSRSITAELVLRLESTFDEGKLSEPSHSTISPERYQELQQQVIDLSAQMLEMMKVYGELNKKLVHLPDISPEEMHEFLEYRKNKPTS